MWGEQEFKMLSVFGKPATEVKILCEALYEFDLPAAELVALLRTLPDLAPGKVLARRVAKQVAQLPPAEQAKILEELARVLR